MPLGRLMQCIFYPAAASSSSVQAVSLGEVSTIWNIVSSPHLHCSSCKGRLEWKKKRPKNSTLTANSQTDQPQPTTKYLLEPWIGAPTQIIPTGEYFEFCFSLCGFYRINNHIIKFKGLILYGIEKQDTTTQKSLRSICLVITRD